jgi:DNA replication protein DnaC
MSNVIANLMRFKPPPENEARIAEQDVRIAHVDLGAKWFKRAEHVPTWKWPRFDNTEWCKNIHPRVLEAGKSLDIRGDRGVAFFGPTGSGKTSVLVAAVHVLRREVRAIANEGRMVDVPGFLWVTERHLVEDERATKWGHTPPLVTAAKRTPFLFLDELGFAGGQRVVMAIIDARYSRSLPTCITSGATRADFITNYSDALYRRIATNADVVDVHKSKK